MMDAKVLQNAVLAAIFHADEHSSSSASEIPLIVSYLRSIADFVEDNGIKLSPSSFETYQAFKGAYRQWNLINAGRQLRAGAKQ